MSIELGTAELWWHPYCTACRCMSAAEQYSAVTTRHPKGYMFCVRACVTVLREHCDTCKCGHGPFHIVTVYTYIMAKRAPLNLLSCEFLAMMSNRVRSWAAVMLHCGALHTRDFKYVWIESANQRLSASSSACKSPTHMGYERCSDGVLAAGVDRGKLLVALAPGQRVFAHIQLGIAKRMKRAAVSESILS